MKRSYRVAQVSKPGTIEIAERDTPSPGAGEVLIAVAACGICGADAADRDRAYPAMRPPRVPGHEVVGRVAALGAGTPSIWKVGQRVGVGRLGGHRSECVQCRLGTALSQSTGRRIVVRWRLRGDDDRPHDRTGFDPRRAEFRRGRAASRGHRDFQRAQEIGCGGRCKGSAGWDISRCNTRGRWVSGSWPSLGGASLGGRKMRPLVEVGRCQSDRLNDRRRSGRRRAHGRSSPAGKVSAARRRKGPSAHICGKSRPRGAQRVGIDNGHALRERKNARFQREPSQFQNGVDHGGGAQCTSMMI